METTIDIRDVVVGDHIFILGSMATVTCVEPLYDHNTIRRGYGIHIDGRNEPFIFKLGTPVLVQREKENNNG